MMGGFGFGWMWLAPLFMIAFLALIVWAVMELVRSAPGHRNGNPAEPRDTALDVLKRRYARGEINRGEFEEKRKDLQS